MKSAYVADLTPDASITSFFLVCEKELRLTREGKPFLRLELGDRSGTIEARLWENADQACTAFERDDIVKVQGRVENYRSKTQLAVDRIRRAEPSEFDLADYFPHTDEDVEQLYARLLAHAATLANPWLRQLVATIIQDPEIVPRLKRAPAAKAMHHAFLGGLLEHVVSLCDLCPLVAAHYKELDGDLLLAGAILHDIGKLDELSCERSIQYTTEGQLLGHIVLELEMVTKKMDGIDGFPADLKLLVKHLLISHHGEYEFGSPKLPSFREALVLHHLDNLDSKMGAARAAVNARSPDELWTAFSPALGRRLLRVDQFRQGEAAAALEAPLQRELALRADSQEGPHPNGAPAAATQTPKPDASVQLGDSRPHTTDESQKQGS
jgi:3'-5' exoribonuclease